MRRYAQTALTTMLALLPAALSAQGVIAGRVSDSATAAPRAGAGVGVVGTQRGAIVGEDGRYVIAGLAPGRVTLRVRLIGYRQIEREVVVPQGDTVFADFRLVAEAVGLKSVRVTAPPVERDVFEAKPNVGTVQITARATSSVPRLGEPDIIRVVQLLPGVEARNDFSTGFNVRGGESDQNLILIDGFPIYNPFHLGGLFSTFIDATVRDVTLLAGGFPAHYGGRLSSVLGVRSAEETRSGVHGAVETSVVASTGQLGGAFAGAKGTWMIAGRRTYADKFVDLVSTNTLPYHFRDEQAHVTYALPGNTRLAMTAYEGRDVLDPNVAEFADESGDGTAGGTVEFSWGNRVVGASLTKQFQWRFGDSATVEQRVSQSKFATMLDIGRGSLTLRNSVVDRRASGALTSHSRNHDWTLGYDVASYGVRYDAESKLADAQLFHLAQNPTSTAAYFDDLWRVSPKLLLDVGGRVESLTGTGWVGFSPRLSAKYFLSRDMAITGAVGRFSQWTHSLAREDIPIRLFDFWVTSDASTPVSSAWHYVLGTERWVTSHRYVRVEAFYKQYGQLSESNPQEDPGTRGDEFFPVNGRSYGFDVMVRQFEAGRFSGWIAYTYALSSRQRDDGVTYFPGHDRRHNLNLVGSWRLSKYVLGARFGYASGTPYTEIVGEIARRFYDTGRNTYGTGGTGSDFQFIGGPRNGARLPSTRRLDLSASRSYRVRGMQVAPYVSVVNAYNAKNVFTYVFDYSEHPPTRTAISQFPLLPSIGVTITF